MRHWIEIVSGGDTRALPLSRGLTRVGGSSADISLAGWESGGELHFWDEPPRVVAVGLGDTPLLVDGRACAEALLNPGAEVVCAGLTLRYHREAGLLEEIPIDAPVTGAAVRPAAYARPAASVRPATPPPPVPVAGVPVAAGALDANAVSRVLLEPPPDRGHDPLRLCRWLWAGLLAEQRLSPPKETKRWQDAVQRREFDADACARDLLRHSPPDLSDERLVKRGERLMRDLVMAPLSSGGRGASKRARGAAKGTLAFVIANLIAITVYTMIILVIFLLLRVKWKFSFDGLFDSILNLGS